MAAVLFLCMTTACVADLEKTVEVAAPASAVASSGPLAELSAEAWGLAADGKIGTVWSRVHELAETAPADSPVASLSKQVAVHESLERKRQDENEQAYRATLDELHKEFEAGKLVDALASAVRASDLIDDMDRLIQDPAVKRLVEMAERKAKEHEDAGRWTRARSLYSGLQLLFDKQDTYSEALKRVSHHVSLLGLFAPEALFDLYKQEAEERGEDAPEPWAVEDNHWQTQLEGIDAMLLNESLVRAEQRHVEGATYKQLMAGALDGLKIFLQTHGLERTFPSMRDEKKVAAFLEFVEAERASIERREDPMGYADTNVLLTQVMNRNRATLNLPEAVIVHELGNGAMRTLDDFTGIIWPHQKKQFVRTITGNFSGVGIQITLVNRQLTVVTPLEDTPAHRAHVRPGEHIVTINGKSTVGISLDQAVDRITGEEGTDVVLGIKNPKTDKVRNVTLTRSSIKIVSVKGWKRKVGGGWSYYVDHADRVGYVRVTNFGPNTADEIDAAVNAMQEGDGLTGLIVDLRMNPGGRLDAAIDVSNRFLDRGTIVSTTQKLITGDDWRAAADESHTYPEFPVVVLINKSSASASEIVSGALQAHHRALIVGERSFGKGSVQHLFRIGLDKAFLKLTTQYYKLPGGRIIHRRPGADRWGVEPDVPVRMSDKQVGAVMRARTYLDILRDPNEKVDPEAFNNNADEEDEDAAKTPPLKSPDEILTRGMDPQLETALLLLKTRTLPVAAE